MHSTAQPGSRAYSYSSVAASHVLCLPPLSRGYSKVKRACLSGGVLIGQGREARMVTRWPLGVWIMLHVQDHQGKKKRWFWTAEAERISPWQFSWLASLHTPSPTFTPGRSACFGMSDALLRTRVRFFLSSILFAFYFHAHTHAHARDVERSLGVSVTYGGGLS